MPLGTARTLGKEAAYTAFTRFFHKRSVLAAVMQAITFPTRARSSLLTALVNGHQGLAHTFETTVVDATEMSQPGTMGRAPLFKLGGATIENLEVTFGDFEIFRDWGLAKEPALLIGMDVLGTLADLSVDYRRKEVELLPRPLQRPAGERQWHSLTFR